MSSKWVKGVLPTKSGNYAVRYNGREGRDDFTTVGNHWWNVGDFKHPEEVVEEHMQHLLDVSILRQIR